MDTKVEKTPTDEDEPTQRVAKEEDADTETPGLPMPNNPEGPSEQMQETKSESGTGSPMSPQSTEDDVEETPVPSTFRASGNQVEVTFPTGKVEYVTQEGTFSIGYIIDSLVPGFPASNFILSVNGMQAMLYDLLELPVPKPGKTTPVVRLLIRERGLPGGAVSDHDIRKVLVETLQPRGLQHTALEAKVEETLSKVSRAELAQWMSNPTWPALKALVGNRITYLARPKKDIDPLMQSDPWASALKARDTAASSKIPPPDNQPQVSLISEVWTNEDGSAPHVLDRPQNGSTGIVLVSPQNFISDWQDTQLPLSADEILLIVWPPIQPPPVGVTFEQVTFPARLIAAQTTITLLHGQSIQFGAKHITLREEKNPQDFPQRSSVSLLLEAYKDELPQPLWEDLTDNPLPAIKKRLEGTAPLLGNWGLRFWGSKGKPTRPHEAQKLTINVLVEEDKLDSFLQRSGDPLWISPRVDQPAFARYRPIWLSGSLDQVRVAHAKLAGACGLIRTKRGFGIRVPTDRFDECRRMLLPDEPAAPHLGRDSELWHFKISPTPVGATAEDILHFIGTCIPDVKSTVKRQLGPRAWLISFASPIDTEYVHSKEGFVVLQPWHVGRKHDPLRNAIVVGNPRLLKDAVASTTSGVAGARGPPAPPSGPPPPRTAQGPVQELLEARRPKSG